MVAAAKGQRSRLSLGLLRNRCTQASQLKPEKNARVVSQWRVPATSCCMTRIEGLPRMEVLSL